VAHFEFLFLFPADLRRLLAANHNELIRKICVYQREFKLHRSQIALRYQWLSTKFSPSRKSVIFYWQIDLSPLPLRPE